jgi:hypothetical protein
MRVLRAASTLLVVAAVLSIVLATAAYAGQETKLRVVIYGDSLSVEAQTYIAEEFDQTKVDLVWHTFGATALCQWLPSMTTEAQTPTAAVMIEFAGNSLDANGCMTDPTTGQAYPAESDGWLSKYTADATQAQAIWSAVGVPTYFMQDPPLPQYGPLGGNINTYQLNILYRSLADHFVEAGSTVASDDGSFTFWKQCDATDAQCDVGVTEPPPRGSNQVRDSDTTHFCPTTGPSASCPVPYSPGAARFGHAEGRAVAGDLNVAPK